MWFEQLTGFREENPDQVRRNLELDGPTLRSRVNGRSFRCGPLETPSLDTLRQQAQECKPASGARLRLSELVADVQRLHQDPANAGSLFQVASQFNLLEMVGPDVTPERGVDIYENDRTQGPACAIAAGAGTIYRNYFAPVGDRVGQTAAEQIDCLADLGYALGNEDGRLWSMTNGYALATESGLVEIEAKLAALGPVEIDQLRGRLRVGIQWDTEVTLGGPGHNVSQVFCSALPVAYSSVARRYWEPLARLVLEATYEASLCAAVVNNRRHGNSRVFLTLVGGGAFGNSEEWILDAIRRAATRFAEHDLDVVIVSYGRSNPRVEAMARGMEQG